MKAFGIIFFLTLSFSFQAQEKNNVDSLFFAAREHAFEGKRNQAISLCDLIIQQSPNYIDAFVLKGRVLAWDRKYKQSKEVLLSAIERKKYLDAYMALCDVNIWSKDFISAIEIADSGLFYFPKNQDLILKKINSLIHFEEYNKALETLEILRDSETFSSQEFKDLEVKIKLANVKNHIGINHALTTFTSVYDPRNLTSLEYKYKHKVGTMIARYNLANRFNSIGSQFEVDLYPKLKNHSSVYLNYGFSSSKLFPDHRIGYEYFKGLKKNFEYSIGARNLFFGPKAVFIFTGSISKYKGNYLFTLRPFITPREGTVSTSLHFITKRFLNDRLDYLLVDISAGQSPDSKKLLVDATENSISFINNQQISFTYRTTFKSFNNLELRYHIQRMELPFKLDNYIFSSNFEIGLKRNF